MQNQWEKLDHRMNPIFRLFDWLEITNICGKALMHACSECREVLFIRNRYDRPAARNAQVLHRTNPEIWLNVCIIAQNLFNSAI